MHNKFRNITRLSFRWARRRRHHHRTTAVGKPRWPSRLPFDVARASCCRGLRRRWRGRRISKICENWGEKLERIWRPTRQYRREAEFGVGSLCVWHAAPGCQRLCPGVIRHPRPPPTSLEARSGVPDRNRIGPDCSAGCRCGRFSYTVSNGLWGCFEGRHWKCYELLNWIVQGCKQHLNIIF